MSEETLKSSPSAQLGLRAERGQDKSGARAWCVIVPGWPDRYSPRFYYDVSAVDRSCACAATAAWQRDHGPFSERQAEALARYTVMLWEFMLWRREVRAWAEAAGLDALIEGVERAATEPEPEPEPIKNDGPSLERRWSNQVCDEVAAPWERHDLHRAGQQCGVRVWLHPERAPDGAIEAILDALNRLPQQAGLPDGPTRSDGDGGMKHA